MSPGLSLAPPRRCTERRISQPAKSKRSGGTNTMSAAEAGGLHLRDMTANQTDRFCEPHASSFFGLLHRRLPGKRVCRGTSPRNSLSLRMIGEFVTVRDSPMAFSSEEPGHTPQAPRLERSESSVLKRPAPVARRGYKAPRQHVLPHDQKYRNRLNFARDARWKTASPRQNHGTIV